MKESSNHEYRSHSHRIEAEKNNPVVLLVEDDDETRNLMEEALRLEHLNCITARSVGEAIDVLQRTEISVMVLDWGLDRSGAEVLSVAKELYPLMPVIAMSGLPFDVRTDAVVNQADTFLQKPFSATVLISQVRQAIERIREDPAISLPQRAEDIRPLDEVKTLYIRHVVHLLDGSISRAAAALGLHRQTVSAALKQNGSWVTLQLPTDRTQQPNFPPQYSQKHALLYDPTQID